MSLKELVITLHKEMFSKRRFQEIILLLKTIIITIMLLVTIITNILNKILKAHLIVTINNNYFRIKLNSISKYSNNSSNNNIVIATLLKILLKLKILTIKALNLLQINRNNKLYIM